MWLEDKETKLTDQEQIRLVAADVEKQIEKAKVILTNYSVLWVSSPYLVSNSLI
ncbi:hypothetical protein DPMN_088545 [Dreissena polymorpha]|uniref:Uncharacterized protein n=1 Tax=Dreissena polymorpha TaxID=45954 RepID=A0A9D4KUQ4_DREPO|nr:hypothetical protein DPMN_088545 [Dreissena polymorpha]